jgi:PhnB protein
MKAASHIPEGFRAITPYLIVEGAARYLDFLRAAFGAEEILRMPKAGDHVQHAQLRIGDSVVEVGEQPPDWTPRKAALHLYVPDADAVYRRALAAGATSMYEPEDKFYGDREAGVEDPAGNQWFLATHREDLPLEEVEARAPKTG